MDDLCRFISGNYFLAALVVQQASFFCSSTLYHQGYDVASDFAGGLAERLSL